MNRSRKQRRGSAGFTLVEILIALSIGSLVLAGVTTSYIFSLRGFRRLANHNEMQAAGRRSLDWFARDIRAGMAVSSCSGGQVVVLLPRTVDAAGVVTATNVVTHQLQSGAWSRTDGTGAAKQLTANVTSLAFSLYDHAGNVTTQANQAVSVQVDATLTKSVQNHNQTADFLSARYRMRNTP
ncbi:prepilin-type N-terminal cleavage/methylation domain-containing protein [bacterium]|nr:prepilin-type N-terminal cleavage/methylation domain-containing protein [bacterium]